MLLRCVPEYAPKLRMDFLAAVLGRLADLHNYKNYVRALGGPPPLLSLPHQPLTHGGWPQVERYMTGAEKVEAARRFGRLTLWNPMQPDGVLRTAPRSTGRASPSPHTCPQATTLWTSRATRTTLWRRYS